VDGAKITTVVIPTFRHNNCVIAYDDRHNEYRITTDTLRQVLSEFVFNVKTKRVHTHLVEPELRCEY